MRLLVESLAELDPVDKPITAAELSGRWELLYTTVELFRASPFFQMARGREEGNMSGVGESWETEKLEENPFRCFGGEDLWADSGGRHRSRPLSEGRRKT